MIYGKTLVHYTQKFYICSQFHREYIEVEIVFPHGNHAFSLHFLCCELVLDLMFAKGWLSLQVGMSPNYTNTIQGTILCSQTIKGLPLGLGQSRGSDHSSSSSRLVLFDLLYVAKVDLMICKEYRGQFTFKLCTEVILEVIYILKIYSLQKKYSNKNRGKVEKPKPKLFPLIADFSSWQPNVWGFNIQFQQLKSNFK